MAVFRRLEVQRSADALRNGGATQPAWGFPNSQGDVFDSDEALSAFKRALRGARLPGHFAPHSLRHSDSSILISEGMSPAYVQRQLGRSTYALMVDTYGKWLPHGEQGSPQARDGCHHSRERAVSGAEW
jgi:site-specific recombinase XerD